MKPFVKKLICSIFLCVLFTGCSTTKFVTENGRDNMSFTNSMDFGITSDGIMMETSNVKGYGNGISNTIHSYDEAEESFNESSEETTSHKLIKNYSYTFQTENYDSVLKAINENITKLNGYIKQSNEYGNTYYSENNRTTRMTVRIPAQKATEFTNNLKGMQSAIMTQHSESVDDVTSRYYDIEAHIKNLKAEEETLRNLLTKTGEMKDILLVEDKLTDVRYEIESYETDLRHMDTLISYSTFEISIEEVKKISYEVLEEPSVSERISYKFKDSIETIKEFGENALIFFAGNIIYISIVAIVCAILYFFAIKRGKKLYSKKEKNS